MYNLIKKMYSLVSTEFCRHGIPSTRDSVDTGFRRHGIPSTRDSVDRGFCQHRIPSTQNSVDTEFRIFFTSVYSVCYDMLFYREFRNKKYKERRGIPLNFADFESQSLVYNMNGMNLSILSVNLEG